METDWGGNLINFYVFRLLPLFSVGNADNRQQVRHRFGLYDKIVSSAYGSTTVRNCNWVRFLRVSSVYGPQVSFSEFLLIQVQ